MRKSEVVLRLSNTFFQFINARHISKNENNESYYHVVTLIFSLQILNFLI